MPSAAGRYRQDVHGTNNTNWHVAAPEAEDI